MPIPDFYSFPRYLAAKKTVDDRALNRPVWDVLARRLSAHPAALRTIVGVDGVDPSLPGVDSFSPNVDTYGGDLGTEGDRGCLEVLEVGAGIGTMIERVLDWGLLADARYTALDAQAENITEARRRLPAWAGARGWQAGAGFGEEICLEGQGRRLQVDLRIADIMDYMIHPEQSYDLLIAHAFLDLLDLSSALPPLLGLLRPGGVFYFSLNFDGATLLEPAIDQAFDDRVQALYHRTMDERRSGGHPSGDSRAGRHLFTHLRAAGAQILAAGASDWVVFPGPDGYPADEAYFLHFIIATIAGSLAGHPELDPVQLVDWIQARHLQIERGELVYIAHQIDFVGVK